MIVLEEKVVLPYLFDLELSGKCNTVCTFCPRDEIKRGEFYQRRNDRAKVPKPLGNAC